MQPGGTPARDGLLDRAQTVIRNQAVALAGLDQPTLDTALIQLATGNELMQPEARAVKRVIPSTGCNCRERRAFAIEHGAAVAVVSTTTMVIDTGDGALGDRRFLTRQRDQPLRCDGQLGLGIAEPGIGAVRGDRRRDGDVAGIGADIDVRRDSADTRRHRTDVFEPE